MAAGVGALVLPLQALSVDGSLPEQVIVTLTVVVVVANHVACARCHTAGSTEHYHVPVVSTRWGGGGGGGSGWCASNRHVLISVLSTVNCQLSTAMGPRLRCVR